FKTGLAQTMARAMLGVSWLLVLGGFVVVSWLASRTAHMAASKAAQYAALAGYVVAESIIFVPLLYIADRLAPGAITSDAAVAVVHSPPVHVTAVMRFKSNRTGAVRPQDG